MDIAIIEASDWESDANYVIDPEWAEILYFDGQLLEAIETEIMRYNLSELI